LLALESHIDVLERRARDRVCALRAGGRGKEGTGKAGRGKDGSGKDGRGEEGRGEERRGEEGREGLGERVESGGEDGECEICGEGVVCVCVETWSDMLVLGCVAAACVGTVGAGRGQGREWMEALAVNVVRFLGRVRMNGFAIVGTNSEKYSLP
jgi:hypothetical protein